MWKAFCTKDNIYIEKIASQFLIAITMFHLVRTPANWWYFMFMLIEQISWNDFAITAHKHTHFRLQSINGNGVRQLLLQSNAQTVYFYSCGFKWLLIDFVFVNVLFGQIFTQYENKLHLNIRIRHSLRCLSANSGEFIGLFVNLSIDHSVESLCVGNDFLFMFFLLYFLKYSHENGKTFHAGFWFCCIWSPQMFFFSSAMEFR